MAVQVLASAVAAFVVFVINGQPLLVTPSAETGLLAFFLLELLFTCLLVLVILNVATSRDTEGNEFYGLAIGFVVMAGAFAAGPSREAPSTPPSRSAPSSSTSPWRWRLRGGLWVYLVATVAGGALAAWAFTLQSPRDA